jgi:hypothetical protein
MYAERNEVALILITSRYNIKSIIFINLFQKD